MWTALGSAMAALLFTQAKQRIVRVSSPSDQQPCEVAAAIDPLNRDRIAVVSIQSPVGQRRRPPNNVYATFDGGKRWTTVPAPNPDEHMMGDDFVAFGPDGFAHRTWIIFEGIRSPRPTWANSGIFVSSSNDLLHWTRPVPTVAHINTVTPFEDKPALVVDCSAQSPRRGNIYVVWTRFDEYGSKNPEHKSHIYLSRSTDGGRTFSVPWRISKTPGDCVDSDNTLMGAVPAVGPDGEILVYWGGPRGLTCVRSTDGGVRFSEETVVSTTPGGWDLPVPGLERHNGLPSAGVDHSAGPHRGRCYACWIDQRNGDCDVFVAWSSDRGGTWSAPKRVNDDAVKNGRAQMFAWLAVDAHDGSVNVGYFDRRFEDPLATGLTLARSNDGAATFQQHKIDQPPFKFQTGAFFGDYIGVSASGKRTIVAYPHFGDRGRLTVSAAIFDF